MAEVEATIRPGSGWIPGSWVYRCRATPTCVTRSSLKPFFFNRLRFSDNGGAEDPGIQ
jgi:hypothetical protein